MPKKLIIIKNITKKKTCPPFSSLPHVSFSFNRSDYFWNQTEAWLWFLFRAHSDSKTWNTNKSRTHMSFCINKKIPHKKSHDGVTVVETFLFPPEPVLLQELESYVPGSGLILFLSQSFQASFSVFEVNVLKVLFYGFKAFIGVVGVLVHFQENNQNIIKYWFCSYFDLF